MDEDGYESYVFENANRRFESFFLNICENTNLWLKNYPIRDRISNIRFQNFVRYDLKKIDIRDYSHPFIYCIIYHIKCN